MRVRSSMKQRTNRDAHCRYKPSRPPMTDATADNVKDRRPGDDQKDDRSQIEVVNKG
jgi:hypothetical protein